MARWGKKWNCRRLWQRMSWRFLIVIMFSMLAALQMLHAMLLSRLQTQESLQHSEQLKAQQQEAKHYYKTMREAVLQSTTVDSSGQYRLVHNVYSKLPNLEDLEATALFVDLTLVSHCSVNKMHHILHLDRVWRGPISLTVFCADDDGVSAALIGISHLLYCVPDLHKNVTFHIVFPFSGLPGRIPKLPDGLFSCTNLQSLLPTKLSNMQNYALGEVKYPNNLLRNIGISNTKSSHILVIDIDMLPNRNLRENFRQFLQKQINVGDDNYDSTVYVLPSFEIDSPWNTIPNTKLALIEQWDLNKVRPFYEEVCRKCQQNTDYDSWRKLPALSDLHVGYEVIWKDPWEPFYIGPRDIPLFDERFKQYGFNRISQACELHQAGYRFQILDNAYVVHIGYKTKQSFHSTKEDEQNNNRLLFRKFKEELKIKYKESDRRCY